MAKNKKVAWGRKGFSVARLLHIYSSTLLFALLIFFAVTGITLNHRWYGSNQRSPEQVVALTDAHIKSWQLERLEDEQWSPKLDALLQYLKDEYGMPSAHSLDVDAEFQEISIEFNVPAGYVSVLVSLQDNAIFFSRESGSLLGVLNDLHKGRHSGAVWFWLLDVSAGLIMVFGITGMIILFQGKRHRRTGVAMAVLGLLTPWLLYMVFVPRIIH